MTPQDFFVADKAASFGWLHYFSQWPRDQNYLLIAEKYQTDKAEPHQNVAPLQLWEK